MRITKRSGGLQQFDLRKIQRALLMAFNAVGTVPDVGPVVHEVARRLEGEKELTVSTVQDCIETVLLDSGHVSVARAYMRYRDERDALRARRLRPDASMVASYIHVSKYAKYIDELGRRELYDETVARSCQMHVDRWPSLEEEIRAAFEFVHEKKVLPSMRSMQFGGAGVLQHNGRLYNCSFTHCDRWDVFKEIFYLLLCGCGVGYSVQWHHVDKLGVVGKVDTRNVRHHTISDSIEGWADAVGALVSGFAAGEWVEFDYSQVRAEGSVLRTSGGLAPGHLPLRRCLEKVRGVLTSCSGRALRPIECHDIICHMAEAVLAGGIRRSSLIALFSLADTEMMYAKSAGVFRPASGGDPGHNAQREMANNSAVLLRGSVDRADFDRVMRVSIENYGDPGFYWTDSLEYGCNPCGEIGLYPVLEIDCTCEQGVRPLSDTVTEQCRDCQGTSVLRRESGIQFCNLTEVNCATVVDADDFVRRCRAAAFIGTLQAAYTSFPYLGDVTEEICRRESLLGVSITGIMDKALVCLDASVQQAGARAAVAENKRVAQILGINPACRVTTVKPSGTASLELGCIGAGIHPRTARRYLQRITANPIEAPAAFFKSVNPHMVEVKPNGDWSLVFPIQCDDDAITGRSLHGVEFVDAVISTYENWILFGGDGCSHAPGLVHNVSCTVTVMDGDMDAVLDKVWNERASICAMTFVPDVLDTKFAYAPRKVVRTAEDEARWNSIIKLYRPVDWGMFKEDRESRSVGGLEAACAGGVCEIG